MTMTEAAISRCSNGSPEDSGTDLKKFRPTAKVNFSGELR